jgi:PKD repeat protein
VTFTDTSTNTPNSWRWAYRNASVGWTQFANIKNPSFIFAAGTYDINLTATNADGSDDEVKTGYITVSNASVTLVVTTYGSSDGEVYRSNTGSGESFTSLRNGAGTGADPTNAYLTLGIRSSNNNNANSYNILQRNVFLFNTSRIPDNAIINNVTLSVWSSTSSTFKNQLGSTSYGITGINPITPGVISQNDYQRFLNTRYSDTDIPQTNIANYKYNTWVFNADGIAAISKTGWTNVVVRTKWDIDNTTTGLTWLPYQKATQITLYAAENHRGKEPTLTIKYTLPQS